MKLLLLASVQLMFAWGASAQSARENALNNLVGSKVHFYTAGLEMIKPQARRWIQSKTGADTLIVSPACKFNVDSPAVVVATSYSPQKDTDLHDYQLVTVALESDPSCKTQFTFVPQNLDLQTGYFYGSSAQQPGFEAYF